MEQYNNFKTSDLFKQNAVSYLAGYVVKMSRKFIKCDVCFSSMLADSELELSNMYLLIMCKNSGGLIFPSQDVIKICNAVENVIEKINVTDEKKYEKLVVYCIRLLDISKLFVNINCEPDDEDENHVYSLIKCIILCYGKIKFHNQIKLINSANDKVRNHFNRLIINAHHQ